MTRVKSATFQGSSIFDADVDAPSFFRLIENAIGDTALVFDKVTGSNGETEVITRDGTPGRGARLGIPLLNQWIGRNVVFTGAFASALTYVVAAPMFIPPGEDTIVVQLVADEVITSDAGGSLPRCYLRTHAFAANGDDFVEMQPGPSIGGGRFVYSATITGITAGRTLFFIDKFVGGFDWFVESVSVHAGRIAPTTPPTRLPGTTIGVTTPGATEGVVHTNFDSVLIGNINSLNSLNGYLTSHLNRNQNGLEEHIRGKAAGGNAAYTHVDHNVAAGPQATNPARSRFLAHTRSLYANEGEVAFPVWCESFGACLASHAFAVGLAEPPVAGSVQWFAPWVDLAVTAIRTIRSGVVVFPDFQTGSSRLKMDILAVTGQSAAGDINNFDGSCGESGSEGVGTFATVPGSGTAGVTGMLALASASALAFTPDAAGTVIRTRVTCTSARKAIDDIAILGACLFFEP